ncbi:MULTISPECIES: hypothetical protein [Mycobacterium]|uniref:hypothetical protein n=1 Tax=Mycobacterium TaxID=1763 RepID=UPI0004DA27C5|nr:MULTISPECIES: hypothetical protein [Mycobacterium]KEF99962.1 hypothetical protein K883_00012 [Mycobacterium sp. TKK-01-0059]
MTGRNRKVAAALTAVGFVVLLLAVGDGLNPLEVILAGAIVIAAICDYGLK